jgi:hypothetical protein
MRMSDIAEKLRKEIERTFDLDVLHHDAAIEIESLTNRLREAEEYGEKMRATLEEIADSGVLTGSFELHDRMSEVAYIALSLPKPWEKKIGS